MEMKARWRRGTAVTERGTCSEAAELGMLMMMC